MKQIARFREASGDLEAAERRHGLVEGVSVGELVGQDRGNGAPRSSQGSHPHHAGGTEAQGQVLAPRASQSGFNAAPVADPREATIGLPHQGLELGAKPLGFAPQGESIPKDGRFDRLRRAEKALGAEKERLDQFLPAADGSLRIQGS